MDHMYPLALTRQLESEGGRAHVPTSETLWENVLSCACPQASAIQQESALPVHVPSFRLGAGECGDSLQPPARPGGGRALHQPVLSGLSQCHSCSLPPPQQGGGMMAHLSPPACSSRLCGKSNNSVCSSLSALPSCPGQCPWISK